MIGETDVTTIFGIRGSGKSTLTRNLSEIYSSQGRLIVFDRLGEWIPGPTDIVIRSGLEFRRKWPEVFNAPNLKIIYQFSPGLDPDILQAEFGDALRSIYSTGRLGGDSPTCIVIEEAQFYSSPQFCNPWLRECVLTGRHAGLALILNSQRPQSIHGSLIAQSTNIFVGQMHLERDLAILAATMGESAYSARNMPRGEFLWFRLGCPNRIVTAKP